MSQWIERVRSHAVWTLFESANALFAQALERDGIPTDEIDSLERLKTVVLYCKKRLESTDPVLVLPAVLDALNNSLTQINASVSGFTSSGQFAQLAAANQQADAILASTVSIIGTITPDDLTMISEATASYRTTLEKALKNALTIQGQLAEKNASNEAKIVAIETAITVEQQRLAALLTEQQSQFSTAQDKRASEFAATQADLLTKFTTSSTEQQTQFSTDQDTRRTGFSDFIRDSQQKVSTLLTDYDEKLKEHAADFLEKEKQADETHKENLKVLQESFESSASEILDEMRQHKKEIESLVGVIGNLGVTSGYKKIADDAQKMLYLWQKITVASLIGLIGVAVLIAFPGTLTMFSKDRTENVAMQSAVQPQSALSQPTKQVEDKGDESRKADLVNVEHSASVKPFAPTTSDSDFYHGLATRIFLSLTFGIFATYAGRQAGRFFTIEQKNRKMALELEALGPFIEPLDKEDRDKFRVQIGDRSFGVPDHEAPSKKEDDPVTILGIIKSKEVQEAIADQMKEALKGLK